MNLSVKRAFAMTFSSGKWFEKLLIGAVIWVIALAASYVPHVGGILNALIMALTFGYAVRVMRAESTATAETVPTTLPEWSNWDELFKEGLLLTLANFIYGVVFTIVGGVILALFGANAMVSQIAVDPGTAAIPATIALLLGVLGLVAVLIYAVFMPMVAAHFAHNRTFGSCFHIGTILGKVFSRPGNALVAIGVSLLVGLVAALASMTMLLAPFAFFVAQVILADIWAQVYRLAD